VIYKTIPFSTEFGFSEQEYDASSTRVAWIDVPTTLSHEEVEARIKLWKCKTL
jgi:hypothetical protein